jgi:cobalt-zinc-cadmium efflux system protein
LFVSGRKGDLNIRGAFLHMAADAAISLGVLIAGAAIFVTGWFWLDPLVSIVIAAIIVWGTWGLLRDAVNMALNAVPAGIDPEAVRTYLLDLPGVESVHDLHIWPMSTTETALTCHLVMPDLHPADPFTVEVTHRLRERFHIQHATLQIERAAESCVLSPAEVV